MQIPTSKTRRASNSKDIGSQPHTHTHKQSDVSKKMFACAVFEPAFRGQVKQAEDKEQYFQKLLLQYCLIPFPYLREKESGQFYRLDNDFLLKFCSAAF